ncbi:hypothetical protein DPMN_031327 [Dreissena polymorpha]|uniref:Uncharacterized protein n=1 Tax=Dreissena polymorpha TaxID=45954 RepID=A0A9D4RIZ7_DREPO|nr:hypothetical protein DPMN_031327 [Dreissena polymorpha]
MKPLTCVLPIGGRKVSFELGCFQYNCECRCNGDLVCPSDKSRYICPGPLECIVCKPNLVPGLVVQPNTTFTLTAGCAYYNSCR